jgi:flagellar basal body L-ring protein FlgH
MKTWIQLNEDGNIIAVGGVCKARDLQRKNKNVVSEYS